MHLANQHYKFPDQVLPPNLSELPRQLFAKTSSSKKRKISTRQSSKDDTQSTRSSPDIPIPSCEQDNDLNFSFSASSTTSTTSTFVSPAYLRADSLPPASSLPPRLQTNNNNFTFTDYASSTASSPSGAYAELTLDSDRGADTPGSEPYSSTPSTYLAADRGTSPFPKITHYRAIMGGAAELPDRASSPLKRRASSMDPNTELDAKEDVDMIAAPPSPPTTTTSNSATAAGSTPQETNGTSEEAAQDETMAEEPSTSNEESATSVPKPPGKF